MKIPPEFEALGSAFYAHSYVEGMTELDWIRSQLEFVRPEDARKCKLFLDDLLSMQKDDSALQEVWKYSGSSYIFPDADLRIFLTIIRDELAA